MTQPSLTTTFDTSLIDLSSIPGLHPHSNGASFSTTDPDTDSDPSDAEDEILASQAVDSFPAPDPFSLSAAVTKTPELSSESESKSDPDPTPALKKRNTPAARPSRSPRPTPAARPGPAPKAIRPTTTPTSSKNLRQSSSPSSSSSSPQSKPHPNKRRKMAQSSPPPPSSAPAAQPPGLSPTPTRATAKKPVTSSGATPIRHMDTTAAYDAWASVYDTDGNILQAVDDLELADLLPAFLKAAEESLTSASSLRRGKDKKKEDDDDDTDEEEAEEDNELRIIDLGCGTGRNTEKVVRHFASPPPPKSQEQKQEKSPRPRVQVTGVDASKKMLAKAKERLTPLIRDDSTTTLTLLACDPFQEEETPLSHQQGRFHAALSTLVLEHLPLPTFFRTLAALLAPGGVALLSNMHPDMGRRGAQAGFVGEGGVKVWAGRSWVHGVEEVVKEAGRWGFGVVGEVREGVVEGGMVERGVVGPRGRKWVGVKVWFGVVVRKVGEGEGEGEGKGKGEGE